MAINDYFVLNEELVGLQSMKNTTTGEVISKESIQSFDLIK